MSDNSKIQTNQRKKSSGDNNCINIRNHRKIFGFSEIMTDAIVLFLSYVISMFIRYNVMESKPGLAVLSTPYLLIALVYSVVMACIFSFALGGDRWNNLYSKSNDSGTYKILSINVVGCLILMSAFYIIGVVNFSRWALVLFWGVSSVLLMFKKGIVQSYLSKEDVIGLLGMRTLVIGDGELARGFISSAYSYSYLGRNILGYVKVHDDEELGDYFNQYGWSSKEKNKEGEDKEPKIRTLSCSGNLNDLKTVLTNTAVDEVVIALEDVPYYEVEKAMHTIEEYRKQNTVNVSMLTPYGNLIPSNSVFYEFGEIKAVDLDGKRRKGSSAYAIGLVLSVAMLMIMMILNLFHVGEFQRFEAFESYKCIIFAIFGVFIFSALMNSFKEESWAITKRAIITAVCCFVFALIYELAYIGGFNAVDGSEFLTTTSVAYEKIAEYLDYIVDDFKAIGISMVICWCVAGIIRIIEKDYPMTM